MKSETRKMEFHLLESEHESSRRSGCEKFLVPLSVFIPLSSLVVLLVTLIFLHKQSVEVDDGTTKQAACPRSLLIGRLVVALAEERDLTVQIVTDKSKDIPQAMVERRESIYQGTDDLVGALAGHWPRSFQRGNSTMFRSPHLFLAILSTHRASVRGGSYFWDEIRFYADVVESFLLWLNEETQSCSGSGSSSSSTGTGGRSSTSPADDEQGGSLFGLLHAFLLLVTSLSYLGAEHSMCLAFHAVSCFSHRETFHYANLTFGAEASFRSYRLALLALNEPVAKRREWPRDYKSLFPELSYCRQEILAEMDNTGEPMNPSVCNHSRRNESHNTAEVARLASSEIHFFTGQLEGVLREQRSSENFWFNLSIFLLVGALVYGVACGLLWCFYLRCRERHLKRKQKTSRAGISLRRFSRNENNIPLQSQRQRLNNCSEARQCPCMNHDSRQQMVTFGALKVASV